MKNIKLKIAFPNLLFIQIVGNKEQMKNRVLKKSLNVT